MQSDYKIIRHDFPRGTDLTIIPIADVHLGAAEHLDKEWKEFCEKVKEEPNTYIMLIGDLINNATRTSVSNVFAETMRPMEQKKKMVEMLEPIKDRILCAVPGNHERRSIKDADDDPMYDIMSKLDLEELYRPSMAFVWICIGAEDRSGSGKLLRPSYTFLCTHGAGGGIYTGASVNRNERFAYYVDDLDCLITAHTHKPVVTQPSKLKINKQSGKVELMPFKVLTATSWLEYGGYAAQKMLQPASFCPQKIHLSPYGKKITVEM